MTQSNGVGVVREAQNRDVRERLDDVVRVDARDVGDHEVGRLDTVRGREAMFGQHGLEFAADEQVDPTQQDRRHVRRR